MQKFLIIGLLLPFFCFSQNTKTNEKNIYSDIVILKHIKNIQPSHIIGKYHFDFGDGGAYLSLDSNNTTKIIAYDCTTEDLFSGIWKIENGILITTGIGGDVFDLVYFKDYKLLIPHSIRTNFIQQFKSALQVYNKDGIITEQEADFISRKVYRQKIN